MATALDDIAFLANSENRVAVFETLVDRSRDRDELTNQVNASRVTIARILRELKARVVDYAHGPEVHGYTARRVGV